MDGLDFFRQTTTAFDGSCIIYFSRRIPNQGWRQQADGWWHYDYFRLSRKKCGDCCGYIITFRCHDCGCIRVDRVRLLLLILGWQRQGSWRIPWCTNDEYFFLFLLGLCIVCNILGCNHGQGDIGRTTIGIRIVTKITAVSIATTTTGTATTIFPRCDGCDRWQGWCGCGGSNNGGGNGRRIGRDVGVSPKPSSEWWLRMTRRTPPIPNRNESGTILLSLLIVVVVGMPIVVVLGHVVGLWIAGLVHHKKQHQRIWRSLLVTSDVSRVGFDWSPVASVLVYCCVRCPTVPCAEYLITSLIHKVPVHSMINIPIWLMVIW
jgi:hypothetical protein